MRPLQNNPPSTDTERGAQHAGKGLRGAGVKTRDAGHTPLPHERDQNAGQTAPETPEVLKQAARDLAEGQVDTDMRATPGLDAAQRERLVPGRGGQGAAGARGAQRPPR